MSKQSFRGDAKHRTSDVQLHIGESRDSLRRNCASEVWSFGLSRNDGALDCFVASLVRATRLKIRAWPALRALVRPHQIGEPPEQIMRVARAGRRLGVILHREYRLALELDAAIGAVEQRNMGLGRTLRQ